MIISVVVFKINFIICINLLAFVGMKKKINFIEKFLMRQRVCECCFMI